MLEQGKVENDGQYQQEKRAEFTAIRVGEHRLEHASERSKPKPNTHNYQQDEVGSSDEIVKQKRFKALPQVCKYHVMKLLA